MSNLFAIDPTRWVRPMLAASVALSLLLGPGVCRSHAQSGKQDSVNQNHRWGEPVAGIKIRLLPIEPIKLRAEPPVLSFATKHEGNQDLTLATVLQPECRLEMDNEVYRWSGADDDVDASRQRRYQSVQESLGFGNVPGPRIVLDGKWKSETDGRSLKFEAGNHKVRFGWSGFHHDAKSRRPDWKRPVLVWSNTIDVVVLDYAEVTIAFNSSIALFDFDKAQTMGPIARGGRSQFPELDLFVAYGGADHAMVLNGQLRKFTRIETKDWQDPIVRRVAEQLRKLPDAKPTDVQRLAHPGDESPTTWAIQTKQGAMAVVRIESRDDIKSEFSGTVAGFVVRYKLLPNG